MTIARHSPPSSARLFRIVQQAQVRTAALHAGKAHPKAARSVDLSCAAPPCAATRLIIAGSMALITLLNAQLAFGHVALLDHADFALESGERIGLIGRNGAGKSSLLKILAGLEKADDGILHLQQGLRIAYVAQEPVLDAVSTVFEATRAGVADVIALIDQYSHGHGDLDSLQGAIEAQDGWNWEQRVEETLQRLHLPRDAVIGTLSGGTKKRV